MAGTGRARNIKFVNDMTALGATLTPMADESQYPALEAFIERATEEDIRAAFLSIRDGLATLKGPKVPLSKKVNAALDGAQDLLTHLLAVRERLEAEQGADKPKK